MRSVKSRVWFRVLVSLLLLGTVSAVSAEDKVGVVFLHGKGMPAQYKRLLGFLEGKGFLVSAPEMPWSKSREYDKPYNEGLNEIDAAVATLRAQGAKYVLIGGHSMGGNAALTMGPNGRSMDCSCSRRHISPRAICFGTPLLQVSRVQRRRQHPEKEQSARRSMIWSLAGVGPIP